jgi:phosphoenolpyruvate carboxylase
MSERSERAAAMSPGRTISDDIYLLAGTLGAILRESAGERAFAVTESARETAKAFRGGSLEAAIELQTMVQGLTDDEAESLVRAFTNYFQLINLAEDSERIRRIRAREASQSGPRRGSLREAVSLLALHGVDARDLKELLSRAQIRLVLTAHPTEARRRTVIAKLARIFNVLRELDERRLLPSEAEHAHRLLAHTIEEVWFSDEVRATQLTVLDEVRTSLVYILSTLVNVIPQIYRDLEDAVAEYFPEAVAEIPPFLTLGTWIGGDRDGNPNVTADVTARSLEMMRTAALELLDDRLRELAGRLSVAETIAGPAPLLDPLLAQLAESFPDTAEQAQRVNAAEPYRQVLTLMRERLHATLADRAGGYPSATDLVVDLWTIDRSLRAQHAKQIADGDLRDVIRIAQVFGFHLATMDIRDHARRHAAALDDILRSSNVAANYLELSETERIALLAREIENPRPLVAPTIEGFSAETQEVLNIFRFVAEAVTGRHRGAIETYVISGAEAPSDLLAVLLLMKESKLARSDGEEAKLSIAPLFEQEQGLRDAPGTMSRLLDMPCYRRALSSRGNMQEVMIGYSDSNKEIGFLGSAWALYSVQKELTKLFRERGLDHTFFHGRGGAIGRGGGPTNVAILAQPAHSIMGRVKLTEQGEVIASRYATVPIAHRELELVAGAVLASSVGVLPEPDDEQAIAYERAMSAMSTAAVSAYRALVYENPDFVHFFEEATPIAEIARLQIGSRPVRRTSSHRIEDLRAIPWVFAWTQSRFLLPGWYGVGTGLQTGRERFGLEFLQEMAHDWPFFAATIGNAEMALAK